MSLERASDAARLTVDAAQWAHHAAHGESIAVNGCCLTIADDAPVKGQLRFDIITQTLSTTALGRLRVGDAVNLEHAVTPESLLGGHIVQGHVDGVGRVARVSASPGETRVRIDPPHELREAIVEKGSIAIDGVSLTVAKIGDGWFEVGLIPTTLQETTLGSIVEGKVVNLETDYIAKTVIHWMKCRR